MPRNRNVDRALRGRQRGVWMATTAILLVGLAVLAVALASPERRRVRRVQQLAVGDTTARVTQLLGAPAQVCPVGSLEHLRGRFPTGWPPAAVEQALDRMRTETAERWVYPIGDAPVSCAPGARTTEIGVDTGGRVRWYVAVAGSTRLRLPLEYAPAAAATDRDTATP